jgi:hypothetical protein
MDIRIPNCPLQPLADFGNDADFTFAAKSLFVVHDVAIATPKEVQHYQTEALVELVADIAPSCIISCIRLRPVLFHFIIIYPRANQIRHVPPSTFSDRFALNGD